LNVGHVVGADFIAHAVAEQCWIEGADAAEKPVQLGIDDLARVRRRRGRRLW
jgi:hypothetical protein